MENELKHYGILGQKWGVRRYQNSDGTLTSLGKQRYSYDKPRLNAGGGRLNLRVSSNRIGDSYGSDKSNRMSKSVVKTLEKQSRKARDMSNAYTNISERQKNKGNKVKAERYKQLGLNYKKQYDQMNKRIDDISSGKIRAGKDFVENYSLTTLMGVTIGVMRNVDFKDD